MPTLTFTLPDTLDEAAARLALALGLFQEGHVSVGKAAEIADLSYRGFLDALRQRGIPAYVYDDEALAADLAFIEEFRQRRGDD